MRAKNGQTSKVKMESPEFPLVQLKELHPPLNSHLTLYMLENFGSMVKLSSPCPAQLGTLDGARHPISDEIVLEAVNWIDEQIKNEQIKNGKKKVLIHCRAGIGRSGSVGVAYCFYKNPLWNYEQTLQYIWSKKPDIYPHSGLQESLERLFSRK
jgi:hypothetical protein